MALAPGTRLGSYQVTAKIGEGGMGEVYRARDTRLGRDVAIKTLLDALGTDPERIVRLEREARVLAALNHPHIAAIYGIEEVPSTSAGQAPVRALVLELVEGPTLAERLQSGPLAVTEALALAQQIAEALDAAHERGIIHRDLKPANIKVTPDGVVKVLDFGLAKLASDTVGADLTGAPTVTAPQTRQGTILGTARYMSPEQARGQALDKRTDIWSFGCVLYELLTGRAAFPGQTLSDTLAAVLSREPDWSVLPESTPAPVRALLRRCLEKDRKRRLRDIGDAALELEAAPASPTILPATGTRPTRWRSPGRFAAILSGVVAVVAVTLAAWAWLRPRVPVPAAPVRMSVTLPPGVRVTQSSASSVALSPDGRTLVIAGTDGDGPQLYRRTLDRLEASPLSGTEGGVAPFFSPDGEWIGFFAGGRLRRIPASGGAAVDITRVPEDTFGASWGPDDRIALVWGARSPLHVVSAGGGNAEPLTRIEGGEEGHYRPEILPGGRTLLFDSGGWVHGLDLVSGRRTALVEGVAPRFAATGHLILCRGTTLLAAPFDPSRLELSGAVVPLPEQVSFAGVDASRHYAISRTGVLAYVPAATAHSLVLVEADGTERLVTEERPSFENPQFSPDGRLVAVASRRRAGEDTEIWVYDLETGTASRLTFDGGRAPVWTPDGAAVTFSHLGERRGIYTKPADGRGGAEQIIPLEEFHWLVGWTPDGQTLAFGVMEGVTGDGTSPSSIVAFSGGERRQVVESGSAWGGRLSPDGRWLAYYWFEAGSFEVYVTPFPEGGTRWQISQDGGRDPKWGPDGTEVYFRSGDRLMAAAIDTTAGVRPLPPRLVIQPFSPPLYDDYDIHPDGRTLVLVRAVGGGEGGEVTMVLNWDTELR